MFDFPPPPAAPTPGQVVTGPNGATYTWGPDRWRGSVGSLDLATLVTQSQLSVELANYLALNSPTYQVMTSMFSLAGDAGSALQPVTLQQLNAAKANIALRSQTQFSPGQQSNNLGIGPPPTTYIAINISGATDIMAMASVIYSASIDSNVLGGAPDGWGAISTLAVMDSGVDIYNSTVATTTTFGISGGPQVAMFNQNPAATTVSATGLDPARTYVVEWRGSRAPSGTPPVSVFDPSVTVFSWNVS